MKMVTAFMVMVAFATGGFTGWYLTLAQTHIDNLSTSVLLYHEVALSTKYRGAEELASDYGLRSERAIVGAISVLEAKTYLPVSKEGLRTSVNLALTERYTAIITELKERRDSFANGVSPELFEDYANRIELLDKYIEEHDVNPLPLLASMN